MFYYIYVALALTGAVIATYFDLKTRIIPKGLTLGLLGLAFAIKFVESGVTHSPMPLINSVIAATVSYIILYFAWRFGVLAGGDVKLLVALSALLVKGNTFPILNKYYLIFLPILWNGILLVSIPLLFYLLYNLNRKVFPIVWKSFVSSVGYSFLVYSVFSFYSGWFSLLLLFVLSFIPYKWLVFLVPGAFTISRFGWYQFGLTFLVIFSMDVFFQLMMRGRDLFKEVKHVRGLKEGDIIVGVVGARRFKFKTLARGATKSDIQYLRERGVERVYVQRSIPFTPIILLGLLVLVSVGDLIWLVVR